MSKRKGNNGINGPIIKKKKKQQVNPKLIEEKTENHIQNEIIKKETLPVKYDYYSFCETFKNKTFEENNKGPIKNSIEKIKKITKNHKFSIQKINKNEYDPYLNYFSLKIQDLKNKLDEVKTKEGKISENEKEKILSQKFDLKIRKTEEDILNNSVKIKQYDFNRNLKIYEEYGSEQFGTLLVDQNAKNELKNSIQINFTLMKKINYILEENNFLDDYSKEMFQIFNEYYDFIYYNDYNEQVLNLNKFFI